MVIKMTSLPDQPDVVLNPMNQRFWQRSDALATFLAGLDLSLQTGPWSLSSAKRSRKAQLPKPTLRPVTVRPRLFNSACGQGLSSHGTEETFIETSSDRPRGGFLALQ